MTPVPGRFTIVVPSFQQGTFLERTLQSILNQDYPAREILVRDGGSTDESVSILKRFESRVRWHSERDNGQAAAINAGFREATGEYFCFLNSDDVLHPGTLRRVHEYFAGHPDALVVYGHADYIGEDDQPLAPYPVAPWDYNRLLEECFICQPACFWRRAVWEQFGPLDESLHHALDYEYWLRIGKTVPFHFLPVKLAASRVHRQAKSFRRALNGHAETIAVLQRYRQGRIPPRWIVSYARQCGMEQLRTVGPRWWRAMKLALSYWAILLRLGVKVSPRGHRFLLGKLYPPYASACQELADPITYLIADLTRNQRTTSQDTNSPVDE